MRIPTHILALFGAFAPIPAIAQQPEDVRVIAAATAFVRDSVISGHGRIVIDETYHKRSPAVSAAVAEDVARAVGAARGQLEAVITCPDRSRRARCSSSGNATVITFARPSIQDTTASIEVAYHYVDVRDRPQMSLLAITLARGVNGKWQVRSVRDAGAS
jgi:hypothetical protein